MQVKDMDLLALQTAVMRQDKSVQGFSAALTDQLRQLAEQVQQILIYGRIDELPEEILDILAWQFNVDWYDAEADLMTKRQAVNDFLIISRTRGTPAAVKRVVEIYFGSGSVEEWFDYGGEPYHFRVVTDNPAANAEKAELLIRAVDSVKNLRSHLEAVVIQTKDTIEQQYGIALRIGDVMTVRMV